MTPVVISQAPVGTHRLVLSNNELGIRREVEVSVAEGSNPVFVLDLTTGKILPNPE